MSGLELLSKKCELKYYKTNLFNLFLSTRNQIFSDVGIRGRFTFHIKTDQLPRETLGVCPQEHCLKSPPSDCQKMPFFAVRKSVSTIDLHSGIECMTHAPIYVARIWKIQISQKTAKMMEIYRHVFRHERLEEIWVLTPSKRFCYHSFYTIRKCPLVG